MGTQEEVILKLKVHASLKRSDVVLKVKADHLRLAISGEEIYNGELAKEVDPEESSWSFETDGTERVLLVSLAKVQRSALKSAWEWPCIWKSEVASVAQNIVNETVAAASTSE